MSRGPYQFFQKDSLTLSTDILCLSQTKVVMTDEQQSDVLMSPVFKRTDFF